MSRFLSTEARRRVIEHVERFHWWHTTLGTFGNVCFVVGSVLFLWESTKLAGIWLFIVGSFGMLLGSLGDAAAQVRDEHERGRHQEVTAASESGVGQPR